MSYEPIERSEFIKLLERSRGVTIKDTGKNDGELAALANEVLKPASEIYSTVLYFADVEGKDYIIDDESSAWELENAYYREDIEPAEWAKWSAWADEEGLNHCQRHIMRIGHELDDGRENGEDWWTILSFYGLGDYLHPAREEDSDVAIWVNYKYSADVLPKDRKKDGFYNDGEDNIIFDTVADARAQLKQFAEAEYLLAVGEISRPTYVITN